MKLTRAELYELVWSEPLIKIASRLDVSGTYLARICDARRIPRPERGHWAKLAAGHIVDRIALPKAQPGDPTTWSTNGERDLSPPVPRPPKAKATSSVKIPRGSPHPILRDVRTHLQNSRSTDADAYLKPYKRLLPDITTSTRRLDDALSLADALYNSLRAQGHRVIIASAEANLRRANIDERRSPATKAEPYRYSGLWSPQRPTVVYVDEVAIGLAIIELSEPTLLHYVRGKYIRDAEFSPDLHKRHRNEHSWTTTRDLPSGAFRLVAYSPYHRVRWELVREGTPATLLTKMRVFSSELTASAPMLVSKIEEAERKAEAAHKEWLAEQELRRREEDRRQVAHSISESRHQLAEVIQEWSRVMSVSEFLAGVERRANELCEEDKAEVSKRLALAKEFLGTQDPLEFFRSWRAPGERYAPKYPQD